MRSIGTSTPATITVLMVSASDHVNGAAGLTLSISISKNGSAFSSITRTTTDCGYGWYAISLTASDTDTPGDLIVHVDAPGADPSDVMYNVGAVAVSKAVRSEISPELSHLMVLQNGEGLDTVQATMLLEIYRLYGLDPTVPLVVTQTSRAAGSITQTISGNSTQTTVTRNG